MGDLSITLLIICQILISISVLIQAYYNKQRDKEIEKLKDEAYLLKDGFKDHWILIKKLLDEEDKRNKEK